MNVLKDIKALPVSKNKVHQAELRSTSVLQYVLEMIKRGDSPESIFNVVSLLMNESNNTTSYNKG